MQTGKPETKQGKCHFRYTSIFFFGEVISWHGVQPDPQKLKALTEMPPAKVKRDLQAFLGMINYLGKHSPNRADVCKAQERPHQPK